MVQPRAATAGFALATRLFQACKTPGSAAFVHVGHRPWRLLMTPRISKETNSQFVTRLFGSKSGSGIPGNVSIDDDQTVLANIDQGWIRATVNEIREYIGSDYHGEFTDRYATYDVSIFLVEDEAMQEANRESRNVDKPTDILSFPFHDAKEPGVLADPIVDFPDYYNLGDIIIDVPYVMRSCEEDRKRAQNPAPEGSSSMGEDSSSSDAVGEVDDEEEWVDDDRGVSYAMSKVFDPEQRIHMLLVHGLLHLVGYDHETDYDYELMVTKEDEILRKLEESGLLAAKERSP